MARTNSKRKSNVLITYGRSCVWCSQELDAENATIDHVLCVDKGGSNWIGNLLPSCQKCNFARGNMSAYNWLQLCLANHQKVRLGLATEALQRLEDCPRVYKVHDHAYQLLEQQKRKHTWYFGQSLAALRQCEYLH